MTKQALSEPKPGDRDSNICQCGNEKRPGEACCSDCHYEAAHLTCAKDGEEEEDS